MTCLCSCLFILVALVINVLHFYSGESQVSVSCVWDCGPGAEGFCILCILFKKMHVFLVLPLVPVKNVVVLVGSTTDRDGLAGMGQDRMRVFTRFCSSIVTGQGDAGCTQIVVPFEGILGPPIPSSPAVPPVPLSRF